MPKTISRVSLKHLTAYSAAAGMGAFVAAPSAKGGVVIQELQLHQTGINQQTDIDWDGDGTFDHWILNGLNGIQVSPWCDKVADPACKGFDANVTSRMYSSVATPDAIPLFTGNSYYVTGFDPGQTIDANSHRVHFIDEVLYTGFLTFLGFGPGFTHTAPGDFAGFSFDNVSGTHFGWLQVGLQTGPAGINTSRFLRYAYETDPGVGITTPVQGDMNFDGFVGLADLNNVLANFGDTVNDGDWMLGDASGRAIDPLEGTASDPGTSGLDSGDGLVDQLDLDFVLGNLGGGVLPSAPAQGPSSVPEPASLVLLAAGAGAVGLRRRRKN